LKQLISVQLITNNSLTSLTTAKSRNIPLSDSELTNLLVDQLKHIPHCFLIIDAFDELLYKNTQNKFLNRLKELVSHSGLQLMITSRSHLKDVIDNEAEKALSIVAQSQDIQTYIQYQLSEYSSTFRRWVNTTETEEKVIKGVMQKAAGRCVIFYLRNTRIILKKIRFLLAHLHMETLQGIVRLSELTKALNSLPDTVYKTYNEAIIRINSQPEKKRRLAYYILSWIILAFRPLSLQELSYALELTEGNSQPDTYLEWDFITSVCEGLIVLQEESKQVKLVRE